MGNLTRGNLLATLKELKKHKRPKVVVANASVQAICGGSVPKKSNSKSSALKEVIAKRREILCRGLNKPFYILSAADISLLNRLVTLHDYRTPYNGEPYGELFIHWFYRDRKKDSLSRCEIFHLNMLQYFNVMDKVKVIHVRCAAKCPMSGAMQKAVEILSCGKATVDFKVVPQSRGWEHDTFKECVEYALFSGAYVYYTHIKGATRIGDSSLGFVERPCRNSSELDIFYWCYLMYRGLFEAPIGSLAIGPLPYRGMNKSYRQKDISWSRLNAANAYFYCGSFQAFSGDYLNNCFKQLNLNTADGRQQKIWGFNDPYTVEMFLSLVCSKEDIYSLDVAFNDTHDIYHVYSNKHILRYLSDFKQLYLNINLSDFERDYFNYLSEETDESLWKF